MFYYLKGTVAHMAPYLAVVDCGGVGYACRTTHNTLARLKVGESAKLYTHLYVREEIFELYGFATEEEKNCFLELIGVSGVGPKAALSILSSTSPEGLAMSIITGDEKALTVAPGIGKKIAQRIILELKDKLAKEQGSFDTRAGVLSPVSTGGKTQEAASALAVLGYSSQEISAALKGVDTALPVEEIIRIALKKMVR